MYPSIIHDSAELNSIDTSPPDELELVRREVLQPWRKVFPDELPAGLPPSREVDHKIELVPWFITTKSSNVRLVSRELVEFKKQLEELIKSGFHPTE